MSRILLAAFILLAMVSAARTQAQDTTSIPFLGEADRLLPRRIALVIGVEHYDSGGALQLSNLPDATKDAEAVAQALRDSKFDHVDLLTEKTNENKPVIFVRMLQAINDFVQRGNEQRSNSDDLGPIMVFYFAGHGINVDGKNYLLPSDFYAEEVEDIHKISFELVDELSEKLEVAQPSLRILISDACRTEHPSSMRSRKKKAVITLDRGVVNPMLPYTEESRSPPQTIFLFSALERQTATATLRNGGIFTQHLVNEINEAHHLARQSPESAKADLRQIFEVTKSKMGRADMKRPQIPDMDDRWGSKFVLFPSQTDYSYEQAAFKELEEGAREVVKNAPSGRLTDDLDRYRYCAARDNLLRFSRFSYFSKEFIEAERRYFGREKPDCGTSLSRPQRRNTNQWSVPSLERDAPMTAPPPPLPRDRGDLLFNLQQVSWAIGRHATFALRTLNDDAVRQAAPVIRLVQLTGSQTDSVQWPPPGSAEPRPADSKPANKPTDAISQPSLESAPEPAPPPATVTFEDVRAALDEATAPQAQRNLPPPDVLLDKMVVVNQSANVRALPNPRAAIITAVGSGELLEIVGLGNNQRWVQVRHPRFGTGFIDGSLVEPALVRLNLPVTFDPKSFQLDDRARSELVATFGRLNGVVIAEATIEYPAADGTLGFVRATAVRSEFRQIVKTAGSGSSTFTAIREIAAGASDSPAPNTVRLAILALPLDQQTRATIATVGRGAVGSPIEVDVGTKVTRDAPADSQTIDLTYCKAGSSNCRAAPSIKDPALESIFRDLLSSTKALQDGSTEALQDTIRKLQDAIRKLPPSIKF